MKNKIQVIISIAVLIIGMFVFNGCAYTVKTIPLSVDVEEGTLSKAPISEDEVRIFRSTPLDSSGYKRIGMLVVSGNHADIDLEEIYTIMRKEAAKRGAEYIIDFTIKMKKNSVSHTDDDGKTVWEDVYTFSIAGTMASLVSFSSE